MVNQEFVIRLAEKAVYTILIVAAPVLLIGLVVGLLVSIFQATTQIQEQTLAFIPKIVAILISLVFLGKWMLTYMLDFTNKVFESILQVIG
jgi:flagellar biosynthetic protein FliQ